MEKQAHKGKGAAATGDEGKKCFNCGQDFLFLLYGGFKEWQLVALADIPAFLPASPSVWFCLSEKVG